MLRYRNLLLIGCFFIARIINGQHQLYNDEFDQSNFVENWNNINETEGWNIQQLDWFSIEDSLAGHFQIAPHSSGWFNEYKGALLYKELSGDFVVTTEVESTARNGDIRPASLFSLAGILIRSPLNNTNGQAGWTQDEQDFIFLAIGNANGACSACPAQLEVKTTDDSNSTLSISNINSNRIQLRIARIGPAIVILYREIPSGNWVVHQRYHRSDFPDTLQVGFTTYTDWTKVSAVGANFHNQNALVPGVPNDPAPQVSFTPDLIANFDFYRLDHFIRPSDLVSANFALADAVPDSRILALLGYQSMAFCPERFDIYQPVIDMPRVTNSADTIYISSSLTSTNISNFYAQEWIGQPEMEVSVGAELTVSNASCQQ